MHFVSIFHANLQIHKQSVAPTIGYFVGLVGLAVSRSCGSNVWFDFFKPTWVGVMVCGFFLFACISFICSPICLFYLMISELQGFYENKCGTNAFQFLAVEDERYFSASFLYFFVSFFLLRELWLDDC